MARRGLSARQRQHIQASRQRRHEKAAESTGQGAQRLGLVVARFGASVTVEDAEGRLWRCSQRSHLGPLVPGDQVHWQSSGPGQGVVTDRLPRRSLLARHDLRGREKPLAANLDQLLIVVAPLPLINPDLIDRYLAIAEFTGIPPSLLINKSDLLDSGQRLALERRLEEYRRIGYPLYFASTKANHGLDHLRETLKDHTSVLVGQSGVGKSSLVKALIPDLEIRVGALSEASGQGRHTTTTATLYPLPQGGALIDSPGVRNFHLWQIDPRELQRGYREFLPLLGRCRFNDCGHDHEPGCALIAAARQGAISPRRLDSYRRLRRQIEANAGRNQG